MSELKVGGEVDAYCTRCKMVLAHTVLAIWAGQIKKCQCNTCGGQHAFRKAEPGAASSSGASVRVSRPRSAASDKPKAVEAPETSSYDELIAGKDRASAQPFNIKQKFAVGDLVSHPTFGLGVVAAARGLDKIDVAFPGTVKTLQHNKSASPTSFAKPPPARTPDVAVAEEGAAQEPDPAAETSDEG